MRRQRFFGWRLLRRRYLCVRLEEVLSDTHPARSLGPSRASLTGWALAAPLAGHGNTMLAAHRPSLLHPQLHPGRGMRWRKKRAGDAYSTTERWTPPCFLSSRADSLLA